VFPRILRSTTVPWLAPWAIAWAITWPVIGSAAGPARAEGARDVPAALADLAAADAETRRLAELWLGTHLVTADFPPVAEAASRGGAEVLLRLGNAIGSDDRHLGLAALCFADDDANVRRVGKRAIEDLVLAWLGVEAESRGRPLDAIVANLPAEPQRRFALTLGHRSLIEEIDLVDRAQRFDEELGLPRFGVSIDPKLRADRRPGHVTGEPVHGTWLELLASIVAPERFLQRDPWTLEIFGGQLDALWIRVVAPDARRFDQSPEWVLGRWLRTYLTTLDRDEQTRAALALAGSGWPAVVLWLEERWLEEGESAAFAGLVHAAARGRCAPGLTSELGYAELLHALDRSTEAERGPSTAELVRALIALGRLDGAGRSLAHELVDGWSALPASSRNVRLAILAECGGPPASFAAARARELAGDDELGGKLAWRTVVALAARPTSSSLSLAAARAREVVAGALAAGVRPARIARTVARAGAPPPPAWREPSAVADERWDVRLTVLTWWLEIGATDAAAEHVRRFASADTELDLGAVLAALRRAGRAGLVRTVLDRAFPEDLGELESASPAWTGARLAALAGVVDDTSALWLAEHSPGRTVADLTVLGALAGRSAARGEAWERLADHVRSRGSARVAWVAGLERALTDSLASTDDRWAVLLHERALALVGPTDPLSGSLESGAWPPGPGSGPPDLVELEAEP